MKGTYQDCEEKYLHRYAAKFGYRYNTRTAIGFNDLRRAEVMAGEIKGTRLAYRRPYKVAHIRFRIKREAKRFFALEDLP